MQKLFELYNTETEMIEASALMTSEDADWKNEILREQKEPQRWVPYNAKD